MKRLIGALAGLLALCVATVAPAAPVTYQKAIVLGGQNGPCAATPIQLRFGQQYPADCYGNQTAGAPTAIPGWTYSGGVSGATSQRADGTWVVYGASGVPRIAAPSSITNLLLNSATLSTQSVTTTAQAYTLQFQGTGTVTLSGAYSGSLVGTGAGQIVSKTFTSTYASLTLTVSGSVTAAMLDPSPVLRPYVATTSAAKTVDDYTAVRGNLWLNSSGTQTVTTVIGQKYTLSVVAGSGSIALTGGGSGTASLGSPVTFTATTTSTVGTVTGSVTQAQFEPVLYTNATLANTTTAFSYPTAYIPTTSAPVYVYDVPLGGPGLLVEEASTNSIRNSSMVGAAAGTPGTLPTNWANSGAANGIATNVIGTGTEYGLPYIDVQWVGTPTATATYGLYFESNTQVAAANAQTWTTSTGYRVVGGSLTNVASMGVSTYGRLSGGSSNEQSVTNISPTSVLARSASTITFASGSTAFASGGLYLGYTNGQAVNLTLRIYVPQLEQKAYATSPIVTSAGAVTRAADVAYVTGLPSSGATSIFAAHIPQVLPTVSGVNQVLAQLDDGSDNNRLVLLSTTSSNVLQGTVTAGGSAAANLSAGVNATLNARSRAALASSSGSQVFSANGISGSSIGAASKPPVLSRLDIGDSFGQNRPADGYISQVTVKSKALTQPNAATK